MASKEFFQICFKILRLPQCHLVFSCRATATSYLVDSEAMAWLIPDIAFTLGWGSLRQLLFLGELPQHSNK